MDLGSSKIYNSSIAQSNLLYKHFLAEMLDLSIQFCQTKESDQLLLCPQLRVEVLSLPKKKCLSLLNERPLSLQDSLFSWSKCQSQRVRSLIDVSHLINRGFIDWMDIDLDSILSELAKGILDEAQKLRLTESFIKVVFPSEGMFQNYVDNNLLYLHCKVAFLVTPGYFCLPTGYVCLPQSELRDDKL